jgi:hypothetical protein
MVEMPDDNLPVGLKQNATTGNSAEDGFSLQRRWTV